LVISSPLREIQDYFQNDEMASMTGKKDQRLEKSMILQISQYVKSFYDCKTLVGFEG
jgi:hypothetical protein